jgi:RNA polymerase sigma factor (sigma-70 family)
MNSSDPDFAALIEECFRNPEDVDVLTQFYDGFRPYAIAILISIAPRESRLYEDAYQSAFVKFLEIFHAGRKAGVVYVAYFVAVAKNCLVDELRRESRHVPLDEVIDEEFGGMRVGVDEAHRREARLLLLQMMTRLSQRCQFMLERYYVAGSTAAELAQCIGIEEASIYMGLKRCREELRKLLGQC